MAKKHTTQEYIQLLNGVYPNIISVIQQTIPQQLETGQFIQQLMQDPALFHDSVRELGDFVALIRYAPQHKKYFINYLCQDKNAYNRLLLENHAAAETKIITFLRECPEDVRQILDEIWSDSIKFRKLIHEDIHVLLKLLEECPDLEDKIVQHFIKFERSFFKTIDDSEQFSQLLNKLGPENTQKMIEFICKTEYTHYNAYDTDESYSSKKKFWNPLNSMHGIASLLKLLPEHEGLLLEQCFNTPEKIQKLLRYSYKFNPTELKKNFPSPLAKRKLLDIFLKDLSLPNKCNFDSNYDEIEKLTEYWGNDLISAIQKDLPIYQPRLFSRINRISDLEKWVKILKLEKNHMEILLQLKGDHLADAYYEFIKGMISAPYYHGGIVAWLKAATLVEEYKKHCFERITQDKSFFIGLINATCSDFSKGDYDEETQAHLDEIIEKILEDAELLGCLMGKNENSIHADTGIKKIIHLHKLFPSEKLLDYCINKEEKETKSFKTSEDFKTFITAFPHKKEKLKSFLPDLSDPRRYYRFIRSPQDILNIWSVAPDLVYPILQHVFEDEKEFYRLIASPPHLDSLITLMGYIEKPLANQYADRLLHYLLDKPEYIEFDRFFSKWSNFFAVIHYFQQSQLSEYLPRLTRVAEWLFEPQNQDIIKNWLMSPHCRNIAHQFKMVFPEYGPMLDELIVKDPLIAQQMARQKEPISLLDQVKNDHRLESKCDEDSPLKQLLEPKTFNQEFAQRSFCQFLRQIVNNAHCQTIIEQAMQRINEYALPFKEVLELINLAGEQHTETLLIMLLTHNRYSKELDIHHLFSLTKELKLAHGKLLDLLLQYQEEKLMTAIAEGLSNTSSYNAETTLHRISQQFQEASDFRQLDTIIDLIIKKNLLDTPDKLIAAMIAFPFYAAKLKLTWKNQNKPLPWGDFFECQNDAQQYFAKYKDSCQTLKHSDIAEVKQIMQNWTTAQTQSARIEEKSFAALNNPLEISAQEEKVNVPAIDLEGAEFKKYMMKLYDKIHDIRQTAASLGDNLTMQAHKILRSDPLLKMLCIPISKPLTFKTVKVTDPQELKLELYFGGVFLLTKSMFITGTEYNKYHLSTLRNKMITDAITHLDQFENFDSLVKQWHKHYPEAYQKNAASQQARKLFEFITNENNLDATRHALQQNPSLLDYTDTNGNTMLMYAVKHDKLCALRLILAQNPSVETMNKVNEEGYDLLMLALQDKKVDCARFIINADAVNPKLDLSKVIIGDEPKNILELAIDCGDPLILKILLEKMRHDSHGNDKKTIFASLIRIAKNYAEKKADNQWALSILPDLAPRAEMKAASPRGRLVGRDFPGFNPTNTGDTTIAIINEDTPIALQNARL